jgi:hypothetical protein
MLVFPVCPPTKPRKRHNRTRFTIAAIPPRRYPQAWGICIAVCIAICLWREPCRKPREGTKTHRSRRASRRRWSRISGSCAPSAWAARSSCRRCCAPWLKSCPTTPARSAGPTTVALVCNRCEECPGEPANPPHPAAGLALAEGLPGWPARLPDCQRGAHCLRLFVGHDARPAINPASSRRACCLSRCTHPPRSRCRRWR